MPPTLGRVAVADLSTPYPLDISFVFSISPDYPLDAETTAQFHIADQRGNTVLITEIGEYLSRSEQEITLLIPAEASDYPLKGGVSYRYGFTMDGFSRVQGNLYSLASTGVVLPETTTLSFPLSACVINVTVIGLGTSTSGDHNDTLSRDAADAHPFSSISLDQVKILGDPGLVITLLKFMDYSWSAGLFIGIDLTVNGDGTVSTSAGAGVLRDAADPMASLYLVEVPATANIALTDKSENYLYVSYNSQSPIVKVTTDPNDFNCLDECIIFRVSRDGTRVHYQDLKGNNIDTGRSLRRKFFDTEGMVPGIITKIEETGERYLKISAGSFWNILTTIPTPDFDSSGTDRFEIAYKDAVGDWVITADQAQLDNLYFNEDGSGLTEIGQQKYANRFVFYILDQNNPIVLIVYGRNEYLSGAAAENEQLPRNPDGTYDLPADIKGMGLLVGIATIKKDEVVIDRLNGLSERGYRRWMNPAHDLMLGVAGNGPEYNHLNNAELAEATQYATNAQPGLSTSAHVIQQETNTDDIDSLKDLVDLLEGSLIPQGAWNADTNTPTLPGTAGTGEFWIVSVAGATDLDGITDWKANDWAVKTATGWAKVDNTDDNIEHGGTHISTDPIPFTAPGFLARSAAGAGGASELSVAGAATLLGIDLLASMLYVQSRGLDLVTNGNGLLGSNYNFPGYVFDAGDLHSGGGSFLDSSYATWRTMKEFVPVDPGKRYRLSLWGKSGDEGGGNYDPDARQLIGIVLYDVDKLYMQSHHATKVTGSTDTTLAVDLNPGDPTITLTDATGWYNSTSSAKRMIAWYGYTNSKGFTYPNYTYTRNVSGYDLWASGGITGNVITLNVPWAGPALSAGDAVRNTVAEGYKYPFAGVYLDVPNAWTRYETYLTKANGDDTNVVKEFFVYTAYIRYTIKNNNFNTTQNNIRWDDVSITPMSSDNLEPATSTSQGVVSLEDQTMGAGDKYFPGDIESAGMSTALTVRASGGLLKTGTTAKSFGDSITVGYGLSDPATTRYTALLAEEMELVITNVAVNGDMCPDQADQVYAHSVSYSSISTLLLGSNDQRLYEADENKAQIFQSCYQALLAWLAIPDGNKILGVSTDVAYTGSWADTGFYGIGKVSSTNGSTAQFSVNGNDVLVSMVQHNTAAGTYTINIDGTVYGTYSSTPLGGDMTTVNNRIYGPKLHAFSNIGYGTHTVTITVTSATGAGKEVFFDWAAGSDGATNATGAKVYVGTVPRLTAAGYVTWGGSDEVVAMYNKIIENNASQLANMGFNVVVADTSGHVNTATDLIADGLHLNEAGHVKLTNAFADAMNGVVHPRDRQLAKGIPNIDWSPEAVDFFIRIGAEWIKQMGIDSKGMLFESNLRMGVNAQPPMATATPLNINMGNTYANAPTADKAKWKFFSIGDGASVIKDIYGIGISALQFNYFVGINGDFVWHVSDGPEIMRLEGNAGYLGIGINAPTAKIHGKGTTSDNTAYVVKADDSSGNPLLSARNDGAFYTSGSRQQGHIALTEDYTLLKSDPSIIYVAPTEILQVISFPISPLEEDVRTIKATNGTSFFMGNNGEDINGLATPYTFTGPKTETFHYTAADGWWS